MCGIAGYYAPAGLDPGEGRAMLERMAAALAHRGPDDRGLFVASRCGLASTRLAIIDVAGGHMPIDADGGRVTAVLNGEIYDHLETRARLGRPFKTRSDSELIPQLYAAEGPELAHKLSGMFAFALWDEREGRLLLARDRFGMKPLYLWEQGGLVLFASELKALLATGRVERTLDPRALLDVATAGYPMPPRSMVLGVRSLPPATERRYEGGVARDRVYWRMPYPRAGDAPLSRTSGAVEEVRDTFDRVVKAHLLADVEVGSYLSGGLDSVSVAARASAQRDTPLRTYSLVFGGEERGFDESLHSRLAAESMRSVHREVLLEGIDEADYRGTIRAMEAPQVHTVGFCLYRLARAVREDGLKVVLSGEGADETFGGYGVFRLNKLRRSPIGRLRPLRRLLLRLALRGKQPELASALDRWWAEEANERARYGLLPPWIEQWWLLGEAASPLLRASLELPEPVSGLELPLDPLHQELAFEQRTRLDGWVLALGDRLSMAHGLEVRVPFLDHRLAELTARVPSSALIRGLREKHLLRAAMEGRIPEGLRRRRKRAFIAPVASWLFGPSRPRFVDEVLASPRLLDPERVRALRAVLERGRRDFAQLSAAWALNLGLGLEILIDELGLSSPR